MCNKNDVDFLKWFNMKLNLILNWRAIDINNHKIGYTRLSFAFVQLKLINYKVKKMHPYYIKEEHFHSRKLIKEFGLLLSVSY